jgi:hypothetical protein
MCFLCRAAAPAAAALPDFHRCRARVFALLRGRNKWKFGAGARRLQFSPAA